MTMSIGLVIFAVAVAALLSLLFSTLTYALRDFSRAKLNVELEKRSKASYLEPTVENSSDLIFVTAVFRLLANILVLVGVLRVLNETSYPVGVQYLLAVVIAGVICLFTSVVLPHSISRHAEPTIALFIRLPTRPAAADA
jgi:Mg2+/Co2+ transporter CorB